MAYLGRRGVSAPLTSADIPAGSVSAVKVASDVATQAELDAQRTNSSITTLGTVTAGNLSNSAIVYPAGHVLQVLFVEDSTNLTTASSTYVDVGLSLAITPKSTSSKILCMWTVQALLVSTGSGFGSQLVRGSANIFTTSQDYHTYSGEVATGMRQITDFKYLDSPSVDTPITYKVQVKPHNTLSIQFNDNSNQSHLVLMEIA